MNNGGWTDERVEELKRLHKDGLSCSMIAKQLGGVTRNAVIGKVHRLGIQHDAPSRPTTFKPYPERKAATARRITRAPDGFVYGSSPTAKPQYQERRHPPGEPIASPNAKVWTEREFGECAYPVDGEGADTRSCCNPTSGAYCAGHASVMFQSPNAYGRLPAPTELGAAPLRKKAKLHPTFEEWAAA